jgi:hypothetical protein
VWEMVGLFCNRSKTIVFLEKGQASQFVGSLEVIV